MQKPIGNSKSNTVDHGVWEIDVPKKSAYWSKVIVPSFVAGATFSFVLCFCAPPIQIAILAAFLMAIITRLTLSTLNEGCSLTR